MPGIRLLVSYADLNQGHVGKIYQGANGSTSAIQGRVGNHVEWEITHRKTINRNTDRATLIGCGKRIDSVACRYEGKPKFKYLLPLDEEIAERIKPLTKIYPQRAASRDIAAPDLQSGEAGEAPSAALQ